MKAFILSVLFIFSPITFSQNVPHLFELRGLEDSLGNTHLFYRYGLNQGPSITDCWSKSIYHFDLNTNIDTLFIEDVAQSDPFGGCQGTSIFDYEFFNKDPAKYIYGGVNIYVDPVPILIRYDGIINLDSFGGVNNIEISNQNENLLYLVLSETQLLKSVDGGYNWTFDYDSLAWIDNAMISLSRNDDSQIYGIDQNKLVRSEDEGYSYIIVDDDSHWSWNYKKDLYYDADEQHVYGVVSSLNESALLVSDDIGNPFTWNLKLTTPGNIWFTLDKQIPGEVYYSYNKGIYKSSDFGNSFSFYKQLEQKITGLYKKSNTDILYASTLFRIYEITPDSIQIIKSIPVPEEAFAWFPLNLGNKWIYNNTFYDDVGDSARWISISEVVSQKIFENQVYQEVEVKEIPIYSSGNSRIHYEYFRVDSANGKIFRDWFENDTLQLEELYMDLIVEVGDTIPVGNGIYLESEEPVTFFGLNSNKRTFFHVLTPDQHLELVKGFGKTYEYIWELVGFRNVLKGCIIKGIAYGDTTVVSVEDETANLPTEFSLSQNYPNPFNPSTKIKFSIPAVERPAYRTGRFAESLNNNNERIGNSLYNVTLKVYDVLGNEIATLVNEEKPAGNYEVEFNGTELTSGIYFYQLKAGSFVEVKKMILIK